MSAPLPLVLNSSRSLDVAIHRLKNLPLGDGVIFEQIIRPFKPPKTYKQLRTIRVLCNELSLTKQNEWVGYSSDWWYRQFKIRAYIPLLKEDALNDGDEVLINLIAKAGEVIRQARENMIINNNEDYTVEDFIADNPAFSYSSAKKHNLNKVIDFILSDSARKGIYLNIEEKENK